MTSTSFEAQTAQATATAIVADALCDRDARELAVTVGEPIRLDGEPVNTTKSDRVTIAAIVEFLAASEPNANPEPFKRNRALVEDADGNPRIVRYVIDDAYTDLRVDLSPVPLPAPPVVTPHSERNMRVTITMEFEVYASPIQAEALGQRVGDIVATRYREPLRSTVTFEPIDPT